MIVKGEAQRSIISGINSGAAAGAALASPPNATCIITSSEIASISARRTSSSPGRHWSDALTRDLPIVYA